MPLEITTARPADVGTTDQPGPSSASPHWWSSLYDDLLAEFMLEREGTSEVEQTIGFLHEKLKLLPGQRAFDQCCGIGSLSLPLAAQGVRVVGVDQAELYIQAARKEMAARHLCAKFHVGDAFEFVVRPRVDGAFNWWTSFGYTLDDEQNALMLRRAFESLKPGGYFALDYMNVPGVLRGFRRKLVTRRELARGPVTLLRESTIDFVRGAMLKRWSYSLPDGMPVEHRSTVRLYMPHSVVELLRGCGFVEIALYGNVDGSAFTMDSPRLIAVAQKPMR